jgi:hypothetical protein
MQFEHMMLANTCLVGFCAGLATARNLFKTEICESPGWLLLLVSLPLSCIYALAAAVICGLFSAPMALAIVSLVGIYSTAKSEDFKQSVNHAIHHLEASPVLNSCSIWWANLLMAVGLDETQAEDFRRKLSHLMAVATYKSGKHFTAGRAQVDQAAKYCGISTALLDTAIPPGTITRIQAMGNSRMLIVETPGCDPHTICKW